MCTLYLFDGFSGKKLCLNDETISPGCDDDNGWGYVLTLAPGADYSFTKCVLSLVRER